jgi:hypothetical protein
MIGMYLSTRIPICCYPMSIIIFDSVKIQWTVPINLQNTRSADNCYGPALSKALKS